MTAIPTVGAYAGWHIEFREMSQTLAVNDKDFKDVRIATFGSPDYYASIDATLPGTLDGGSYTFVIEGMSGEDYSTLYKARKNLVAKLHLFWRDAGAVGYVVDLAGLTETLQGDEPPGDALVAVLRVTALKRRAGPRRYEVVIEARELVYDKLLNRIPTKGIENDSLQAAFYITHLLGVSSLSKGDTTSAKEQSQEDSPSSDGEERRQERSWSKGDQGVKRLGELGDAMERQTGKFGLGMYLIRNGTLYMGPDRLGLIGTTFQVGPEEGRIQIDGRPPELEDPDKPDSNRRDAFELTMRGRPDIKPGDFVEFDRPPEETDELGSAVSFMLDAPEVTAGKTRMYVRGVTHHLSRERAFVTGLRGVSVPPGPPGKFEGWFEHVPSKGRSMREAAKQDDSPEGELAGLFRHHAIEGRGRLLDVGQVRATNANAAQLPAQTEKLRRGLVEDDGYPYAAGRLAFDDGGSHFGTAPYASPFAWGKFGLVLPRYPGMRVLLAHRNGDGDDVIDVGALWNRGQAPLSKPGDYWLILPAAIAEADRERVDDDHTPKEPGGKATNDLIDADGNRVIELGKLTVRVGADTLRPAGTRPLSEAAPVYIEHTSSRSKVVIDQEGNITIQSGKALNLTAEDDITLDSKKRVVVKVGTFMDVKER